jgi:hypothetical protein
MFGRKKTDSSFDKMKSREMFKTLKMEQIDNKAYKKAMTDLVETYNTDEKKIVGTKNIHQLLPVIFSEIRRLDGDTVFVKRIQDIKSNYKKGVNPNRADRKAIRTLEKRAYFKEKDALALIADIDFKIKHIKDILANLGAEDKYTIKKETELNTMLTGIENSHKIIKKVFIKVGSSDVAEAAAT